MREAERSAGWVMLLTLVLAAATLLLRPDVVLGRLVESFEDIPLVLEDWSGADIDSRASAEAVPSCSVLMRDYTDTAGNRVNLTVVYGLDLGDLHKPEYCMEGSGWRTENTEIVTVQGPVGHRARLLRLSAAGSPDLFCLYWFSGPRGSTDAFAVRKLAVFGSTLRSGRVEPTAMIRLLIPVEGTGLQEVNRLLDLAAQLESPLSRMISRRGFDNRDR